MAKTKKAFSELMQAFLLLKNEKEAKLFFEDIFTPQELEALTERWQIVQSVLGSGLPQRKIAEQLGCSVALVTRANRQVKYGTGGFAHVYDALKN